MRLRRRVLLAIALSAGLIATVETRPALAQSEASPSLLEPPRHRQGYYMALGLHGAIVHVWDHDEPLGVWGGSAFTLRMGQLLTKRFGLGLQIDSGGAAKDSQSGGFFGLSMEAQWELARNLAAHGGVGLGVVTLSDSSVPDEGTRGAVGAGYFVGLSYDWFPFKKRLSGGFAVTPLAQLRFIPGETVDSMIGLVGVEFGWWTGLPRNQLELPESEAYKKR